METIKYIKTRKEDSAGHINGVIGVEKITLHCAGKRMFISVDMNSYKDAEAKLAGKSPSIDRVRPESLFSAQVDYPLVDFHNMIVESVAKKCNLSTIEVEGELQLKSPAELKAEKAKEVKQIESKKE